MRKALVLASNRWNGVMEVGIFRFAGFLKSMGYHVEHANLEHFITYLRGDGGVTKRMIKPLPNRLMVWRWMWEMTFRLQRYEGLREEWDLLMCDASPLVYFANRIKAHLKVYRMNDLLEGFGVPEVIAEEERRFIRESDVVLVAHRTLLGRGPRGRTFYVPNPIDLSLFPEGGHFEEPEDLKGIPHPRVVYLGAVYEWYDWETFLHVAGVLKDVSFVIVGPIRRRPPFLPPNVYTLGGKPHRDVHLYLRFSDAAIIPFRVSPLIESMDFPNKVLEFFALGLPTVSVRWEAFSRNFPEVIFYTDRDGAVEGVKEALRRGKDPSLREKVKRYDKEEVFREFRDILARFT